jgi:predicted signal transduction protein with EAL and GGDEF domain
VGLNVPIVFVTTSDASDVEMTALGYGVGEILRGDRLTAADLARAIRHAQARIDHRVQLSGIDARTGLALPALVCDRLELAMLRARRSRRSVGVLALELEGFAGASLSAQAMVLFSRAVAERIRLCIREMDTAGRLDADTFAVLLEDLPRGDLAAYAAQRLLGAMEAPFEIAGQTVEVRPRVGISVFPHDAEDSRLLLRRARSAVRRAARGDAFGIRFHSRPLNQTAVRRAAVERALDGALSRGELELHFQPKVELLSDRVVGAEALLRWTAPELGNVPPDEFVPVLEATDQIEAVGEWVLWQAATQACRWAKDRDPLVVSVNVSAKQFYGSNLVTVVERTLRKAGLPPALLELEITEGVLLENTDVTRSVLQALRDLGVRIAVDDFGTGYASLRYVKNFPLDSLKIDRDFVRGLPGDREDVAITQAILSLAHNLGLEVTAEGVETAHAEAFLREGGCHYAQGFFHARPMPAAAFERFRSDWEASRTSGVHPALRVPVSTLRDAAGDE